jgi:hypothetical protein
VDSTDSAVFGIYRDLADDEQSYFLVTRGTYPDFIHKFLMNVGLTFNPDWKKVTIDGKKWWRWQKDWPGLSIDLSIEKNEAYIRVGDPPLSPPVTDSSAKHGRKLGAFFAGARCKAGTPPILACYVPAQGYCIHLLKMPIGI